MGTQVAASTHELRKVYGKGETRFDALKGLTLEIHRGESVAVIGCGGVGVASIAGAKLAGATTIIAVDIDAKKLAKAKELGATHTVNSKDEDPVEAIRAVTSGFGAELSALVQERCFYHLEAPVERVTGFDTPYPHSLEWAYFPGPVRLSEALKKIMKD